MGCGPSRVGAHGGSAAAGVAPNQAQSNKPTGVTVNAEQASGRTALQEKPAVLSAEELARTEHLHAPSGSGADHQLADAAAPVVNCGGDGGALVPAGQPPSPAQADTPDDSVPASRITWAQEPQPKLSAEALTRADARYATPAALRALLTHDDALGGVPVRLLSARWLLEFFKAEGHDCLLYTSPSPRDS